MRAPLLTRRAALTLTSAALIAGLAACATADQDDREDDHGHRDRQTEEPVAYKPVLYLYPPEQTDIEVALDYAGELTFTYPEPAVTSTGVSWQVTASPDGTLTDAGSRSYPYLFWEGINPALMTQTEGFVVQAHEVTAFLEDKLAVLGLTEREAAEFITFWAPRIQATEQALITFAAEQHAAIARYSFTTDGEPLTPEVFIRVYLVIGDVPADPVPEQELIPGPSREGFTAVEWGGCDQRTTTS
ncbi:transcriptional initiation protein Tat [Actinomyces sp. Z5]|uniref:transcriptional initiation protein Tat n=1 Tax=Actinomyces sp. Z5 TaxID=2250216 RepID=UPI000DCE7B70|nr:transcriptional initiation protein Tat [Actinomyces sp. Z5]RAX19131.1 transcriptional initiation protein Tat [Actinomyces sp. Z5]